jgi:hypothetical protein
MSRRNHVFRDSHREPAAGPVGANGGFHFDQEASDEADDQEG